MPYKSDAQRKAVWASRNERGEKGPVKKLMEPSFSPFKKVRKTAKGLALKSFPSSLLIT